jgi:malonyl-CoA O-methyltransferase
MSAPIRRRFDRAGATYEAAAQVQRLVATQLARRCPPTLRGAVLEIGAGSGLLTRQLLPRHDAGTYVALDLSPGMLAQASMPGAAKVAADGERPPFSPATFDFLVSASAMHWYADPAQSIPANLKLLRPGGGFALSLYATGTLWELAEASRVTGFGSVYPMRPTAFYRECMAALPDVAWTMEETSHTVTHPSVAALLHGLQEAGVTHTPAKRATSPGRYREFSRYYARRFGVADGVTASYAVVTFLGTIRRS